MLTQEECQDIIEAGQISLQDIMVLDCHFNKLNFPELGLILSLSEPQKRLMACLIKGINCKREIINVVWYENHQYIADNNYHQLAFQLRALFKQHQLPAKCILTIPNYGLMLNEPLLISLRINNASTPEVTPIQLDNHNHGEPGEISPSFFRRLMAIGRSFFCLSLLLLV